MNNETKFELNDLVSWCGSEGAIANVGGDGVKFPVAVMFNGKQYYFMLDGRYEDFHKEPSLKLISKAKKKEKWYQVFYKIKDENRPTGSVCLYKSKEDFFKHGVIESKIEWIELKEVGSF